jgi:hypothetical protein
MRSVLARWLAGLCGLLTASPALAGDPVGPGPPAPARLAWELERNDLGGRLSFAVAPLGDFAQASIRPDLEFLGWDRRSWRAQYLGGGQFALFEPEAEAPTRATELRYLDWDEQQCVAKVEHGRFTLIKPPRPAPPPPSSATASTGGGPLQVVPIENPPIVYRSQRLDVRAADGKWSAALAVPGGRLASLPADAARLPGLPVEVLSESGALAMATAQRTNAEMLQMIQKQIDAEQPAQPAPPEGAPVRACFFSLPRFQGKSLCVAAGEGRDDVSLPIASLRIDGGPAQASLFTGPNASGKVLKLTASQPDLAALPGFGATRSLRVESLEPQRGASDPGVAYFFGDEGYRDFLFQLRAGDPPIADLRPSGRDDAISSVRIEGDARVVLYGDLYYNGREWSSATGSPSLAATDAFDDRASSLQVVRASLPAEPPTAQVAWTILHAPNGDWTQAHRDTAINYVTWGGGEWTASYLGGGRFRHTQRGATQSRESIGMNYVDWKGAEWTATVEGEKFRHTRRDRARDELDRSLEYRSWDGSLWSAKLVPPAAQPPN